MSVGRLAQEKGCSGTLARGRALAFTSSVVVIFILVVILVIWVLLIIDSGARSTWAKHSLHLPEVQGQVPVQDLQDLHEMPWQDASMVPAQLHERQPVGKRRTDGLPIGSEVGRFMGRMPSMGGMAMQHSTRTLLVLVETLGIHQRPWVSGLGVRKV